MRSLRSLLARSQMAATELIVQDDSHVGPSIEDGLFHYTLQIFVACMGPIFRVLRSRRAVLDSRLSNLLSSWKTEEAAIRSWKFLPNFLGSRLACYDFCLIFMVYYTFANYFLRYEAGLLSRASSKRRYGHHWISLSQSLDFCLSFYVLFAHCVRCCFDIYTTRYSKYS